MTLETPNMGMDQLDTVGVVTANSTEYLRVILDNLRSGVVSVPLRSADDEDRLQRTNTTDVVQPDVSHGWFAAPFASTGGDAPAQISFTSGTQGAPKAVLLSRGNLHDVVSRVTRAMEIDETIREYVGIPVFHSFGYGRCRMVLNAGGAVYLPPNQFDVLEIRKMAAEGAINAISAVPSLWRIFLRNKSIFGRELDRIHWVEIGSQYMSGAEKKELRELLPNARIVQHYGLTEASRATLLRVHSEPEERLESVGKAEGDVEIDINPEGLIGIRGPNVALGIMDLEEFREIKRDSWFLTSDKGRLIDGYLFYEGRADDIINYGGIKLSPELAETHIRSRLPDCGEFAVVRRPDDLRGDAVRVVLTPSSRQHRDAIVRSAVEYGDTLGAKLSGAIDAVEVDRVPKTASGKVQRAALAASIADTAQEQDGQADLSGAQAFRSLFQPMLDTSQRANDVSFRELGIDSLIHIQATVILEQMLGEAPLGWEDEPLNGLMQRLEAIATPASVDRTGAPPLPDGSTNMNPDGISFWELVREDLATNEASISHQGFLMLFIHRFGNWRMDVKPRLLRMPLSLVYRIANKLAQMLFGMKLDYTVKVGRRVKLEHFGGMILGAREIGDDVVLRQNTTLGIRSTEDLNAKPTIGKGVDIGAGAVIVGNIRIGDNSVIGANSVVYTNIPPGSVAMGVPAKIIGEKRSI